MATLEITRARDKRGQAAILVLGICCALLLCRFLLFGLGRALGAKGRHQRAADLAAMSAPATMRDLYPRLFQPPEDPRHLSDAEYRALATRVALRAAARNGVRARPGDVSFPGASFAPTRVRVRVRGAVTVNVGGKRRGRVGVRARATAELSPSAGASLPDSASGGGYHGPLAYRQGKPMRPDVARAFDRMAASARKEAGIALIVISGYRSDAEQAKLFAAHPDPKWVAPPGKSLHRLGTELDLGPPGAYGWLAANAKRFGFVKRYAWEKWH
jgi:D-alanyl-D-alanine carboxypeptidase-like protein